MVKVIRKCEIPTRGQKNPKKHNNANISKTVHQMKKNFAVIFVQLVERNPMVLFQVATTNSYRVMAENMHFVQK